jgi:mannose-6-phosphate isomerase
MFGVKRMNPRNVEKPWGYELIYAETEKYAGKILFIQKGQQLSLQYHQVKDEIIYLYKGSAKLLIQNLDDSYQVIEMSVGDSYRIKPGCIHRISAVNDCEFLEVSTPELDDVTRLEDQYDRV